MPTTEGDAVAIARKAAKWWVGRYGGRFDFRELLGAAWQGVATRRAKTGRSAVAGIVDYLRTHGHRTRYAGRDRVGVAFSQVDPGVLGAAEWLAAPAEDPAEDPDRLPPLRLWCETRAVRRRWPWQARVYLYLRAVEGMTLAEIARAVGRSKSRVSQSLTRGIPGWADRRRPDH